MNDKIYFNKIQWQQNYHELTAFMQPFIEEWERIVLEEREHSEAKEVIERIKNGNDS